MNNLQITEPVKFLKSKNITAVLWEKNENLRLYINKINCEFNRYKTGNICASSFEWNDEVYGGRSNRRTSIIATDCRSVEIFLDLKTSTWHSNHWDNGYPKITDLHKYLINKFNEDEKFATAVYNVLKKLTGVTK